MTEIRFTTFGIWGFPGETWWETLPIFDPVERRFVDICEWPAEDEWIQGFSWREETWQNECE